MESFSLTHSNSVPTSPGLVNDPGVITLYLPDVTGLECLPESGKITFQFDRHELKLTDGCLSAVLNLSAITDVECDEDAEESKTEDLVDKLFAEAKEGDEDE